MCRSYFDHWGVRLAPKTPMRRAAFACDVLQGAASYIGKRAVWVGLTQIHRQITQDLLKAMRPQKAVRPYTGYDPRHRCRCEPFDGKSRRVGALDHCLDLGRVAAVIQVAFRYGGGAFNPKNRFLSRQLSLSHALQLVWITSPAAGVQPVRKHGA